MMANWIVLPVLATPSYRRRKWFPRKWLEGEESQYYSHSPFLRIKDLGSAFPRIVFWKEE
jgi:hypothetical protein